MSTPAVNPTPAQVTPTQPRSQEVDFSLADLDAMFPAEPGSGFNNLTQGEQGTNPPAQPQPVQPAPVPTPTPEAEFIKAGQTVYKTREDAERGIAHKDDLISKLRQQVQTITGVDPLTGQPVQAQPQYPQPQGPVSYTEHPEAFSRDLNAAIERNDPVAYAQVQQKMILDTLAPLAPVIQGVSDDRAAQAVSREIPDFAAFRTGNEFQAVLQENPKLAQAIELAKSDYRFQADLPDLYKLAYAVGQSRKLPELIKAAQAQMQQAPPAPTRPTTAPSTMTPAPQDIGGTNRDLLATPEGRKQLIERGKAMGLDKIRW